jgi:hypothetical protein
MRLDVTVQRQSKIIKWIMVVVIASFFVAFALAVGGLCLHSQHGSQVHGVGLETNNILEPSPGNELLVPLAYEGMIGPFDTVPGTIDLVDYYFPYYDAATGEFLPLPLCITNEMAQTWWFEFSICGNYDPVETDAFYPDMGIAFYQDQDKNGVAEYIQGWNLKWRYDGKDPNCDCCSCHIWTAIPDWCGNKVCLSSNQYPVVGGGLEWLNVVYPDNSPGYIPGKEVYIHVGIVFAGCELEPQQFAYILAQKRCFFPQQQSPTPE